MCTVTCGWRARLIQHVSVFSEETSLDMLDNSSQVLLQKFAAEQSFKMLHLTTHCKKLRVVTVRLVPISLVSLETAVYISI